MKKAYVSCITGDSFLKGVLVMFMSLLDTQPQHDIDLVCLITPAVSDGAKEHLQNLGVRLIPLEGMVGGLEERWRSTFQIF